MKIGYLALFIISTFIFIQCAPKMVESTSATKEEVPERPINYQDMIKTMPENEKKIAYSNGKDLMAKKCTGCHEYYRPELYSRAHWNEILDLERDRAKLSRQEFIQIKTFVYLVAD